jgi:hypothetical protein
VSKLPFEMETQILIPDALRPPTSTKDLDISMMVVEDLFLRRTLLTDRTSTAKLSLDLGLDPRIIVSCFEQLKARKFLDVLKLEGNNYHFELTNLGRERAQASTDRCSYSDRAPVTLERYVEVVKLLKAEIQCSYADIRLAFSDLVMNRRTLDRIGPAFSAQQSIFFYGPSGTGKTSIAERLVRLYDDVVLVPVAVEVDGQIITVFDPTVHEPAGDLPQGYDPRFVLCKRPIVVTGGELELSMLQLKRDPISKVYSAPLQMKANNGIFLIDDFGRQLVPPGALLNRWIVPLERRIDYLSLDSGKKFSIPFEVLVLFSTNIDPARLGDDAFFRRIQNKIYVGSTTLEEFDQILDMAAKRMNVELSPDAHHTVRIVCKEFGRGRHYPTYPVDLCRLVVSICDYEGRPRYLDRETVWKAAELYFTTGTPGDWNNDSKGVFTADAVVDNAVGALL